MYATWKFLVVKGGWAILVENWTLWGDLQCRNAMKAFGLLVGEPEKSFELY
jgi:hypothetical protein